MEFNYVSDILLSNVTYVLSKINKDNIDLLDKQTNIIKKYLLQYNILKYKKYNELVLGIDYIILESNDMTLTKIEYFDNSPEILALLNHYIKIKLIISSTIEFDINIYHNKNDNISIFNMNINKIMTRLWNLYQIFGNKKYKMNGKNFGMKNYQFNFYLYNNVRKANKNKQGAEYLKELHNTCMRCFNASSGLTDPYNTPPLIVVSRLEETLGLLTHEVLHSVNLITPYLQKINDINIKLRFDEMYVNAFATIFHSYLISKEMTLDLYLILKNELLYCIINANRLALITGYNLDSIYNKTLVPIKWSQNAFLYEYINGRMLILLNFENLVENTFFSNIIFNTKLGWNNADKILLQYATDKIILFHEKNNMILVLYNEVSKFTEEYFLKIDLSKINLSKINLSKIDNNICGNMIMQYFLYDPLIVGSNFKNKYIKYKLKYLQLKKIKN